MCAGPGQQRLGAVHRLGLTALDMDVDVDQAGQQHPPGEVEDPRALGNRIAGGTDPLDDPIGNQHGGAVAHRSAGAVKQPRARQPQATRRGRGSGQQGGMSVGHRGAQ